MKGYAMKMSITEARHEAQRYLNYLAQQEAKSVALQKLAADRRTGKCSDAEKDKRMRDIMGPSPTVYDGANLADAIRVFLKETQPPISPSA